MIHLARIEFLAKSESQNAGFCIKNPQKPAENKPQKLTKTTQLQGVKRS